jgi:heme-degrading monooxygenase HmoA
MGDNDDLTYRVLLRMEIRSGMGAEFEGKWLEVGTSVTEHPANRGQWLLRGAEEEDVYYIVSDWVDEPGFREFETSGRHVEHREKLHPYRSGGTMTTMEVVHHLPHAQAVSA